MRSCAWRHCLLFCSLWFLFSFALAGEELQAHPTDPSSEDHLLDALVDESHAEHASHNSKWSGGSKVHEALEELRALEETNSRVIWYNKKSGFIGKTAYYAKEAFVLLFMNAPKDGYLLTDNEKTPQRLSKPLAKAVNLLESAASEGNPDAIFLLAEMNFYGNFTHPRNYKEAFRYYEILAKGQGNSSAQYMLGFMYATGIGGAVGMDQQKALLYHTFAAKGGDIRSQMTVAFRYHAGVGTARNCDEAVGYYKKVADKAMAFSREGPPGGTQLPKHAHRLADEEGGVYGQGASFVSSGQNAAKNAAISDQNAAIEDVLEYLDLLSRKGELKPTFNLGRLHYDGSRKLPRNFKLARRYFMTVARKYWAKDDSVIAEDMPGTAKLASKAAGYLGRLYLRGEGVEQNFQRALRWFRLGLKNGDALCQYELGLMHLKGLGVRQDTILAATYLKEAAQQDWPAAQVNLGKLFLDQGDLKTAITYFDMAARHQHIEALYHLAEISNQGIERDRSCALATAYYKIVAEKTEELHSSFEQANEAFESGDKETALVSYMMAAEQGYESAQANVAWILDEHHSIFSLNSLLPWKRHASTLFRNAMLALVYWTRSAKQQNIDSLVKMGDYYLGGYGVEADMEKAATCYQSAADMQQSAQALWNLGWMHENGIGVEQDYHLAKRFYDQALETTPESYLPVKLSLLKLRAKSYWNKITNGKIKSIQDEPADLRRPKSWTEWLNNFLEDEQAYYRNVDGDEEIDVGHGSMPGGDDVFYDEIDDGILESLVIIVLACALAFLVYYRQFRQANNRRIEEDRRRREEFYAGQAQNGAQAPDIPPAEGQQADGGFFPPPDDPNFAQWVAGGVGH